MKQLIEVSFTFLLFNLGHQVDWRELGLILLHLLGHQFHQMLQVNYQLATLQGDPCFLNLGGPREDYFLELLHLSREHHPHFNHCLI